MATLGTGIVPSGARGTELTNVTRRAFVPKLVIQLYKATPLLACFLEGAQMASGGVSSVSVPVQGSSMVSMDWSGYDGTFSQPSSDTGIDLAEFNLKLAICAIPFLGMEGMLQLDHAVVPIIAARMNDAENVIRDQFATELWNNYSDTSKIIGLPGAIDDSTNLDTYGGIQRTTKTYWKSLLKAHSPSVNPDRAIIMQHINKVTQHKGEMPSFGICGFGTWTQLAMDYLGLESYNITPEGGFEVARAGFRAIEVAGVPIYADPYATEGTIYYINKNYLSLYLHEYAAFNFTGFESTMSSWQLGYVGAIVTVLELVNSKPNTMLRATGLNSITL